MATTGSIPDHKMTSDEFLAWASSVAPEGKFELHDGYIVGMAPERAAHADLKFETAIALRNAIAKAGVPCRTYIDSIGVKTSETKTYIPDVFVRCGDPIPPQTTAVDDPVIVVEILSPSTKDMDLGSKFLDYFTLPSVEHYLIFDTLTLRVIHHRRLEDSGQLLTSFVSGGVLQLEPPGLELNLDEIFAAIPSPDVEDAN